MTAALRRAIAVLTVAAFVSASLSRALAAPVSVRIAVVAGDGRPVAGAAVTAADSGRALGTTDAGGTVDVTADDGLRVIAKSGGSVSDATALHPPAVTLRVLAKIAEVKSRRDPFAARTIDSASVENVVAGTLTNALKFDPRFRSAAEGGSDSVKVDGIPLPLPPGGGAGHFSAELFASASPEEANGSTVPNFHLVNPTARPQQTMAFSLGSYDRATWKATASGRERRLGYGFSLVGEGDDGVLAGQRVADISGAAYDHSTHARSAGATMNVLYDLGRTQVSVEGIAESRSSADVALVQPGALAEGYGPGTSLPSHDATVWTTIDHNAGRDELFYVGVRYLGGAAIDHTQATFLGSPSGFYAHYDYAGSYQYAKLTRSFTGLSVYAQATAQTFTLRNAGFASTATGSTSAQNYAAGFERQAGAWSYGGRAGVAASSGTFHSVGPEANAHAEYRRGRLSSRLAYTVGQSQTQETFGAGQQVLAPPQTAQFDCAGGTAVVAAPSVVDGAHPRKRTLEAAVSAADASGTKVTLGGYLADERDALVQGLDQGPLAAGGSYLASVSSLYAATCSGRTFSPSALFAQRVEQVGSLRSREAYVAFERRRARFSVSGFYEVLSRFAAAAPDGAPEVSSIVPGAQAAHVPLHRANLLLSYQTPRVLLGADALYTAANNASDLPGHVELFLGGALKTANGVVSLSLENPFGAYGGRFVSSRYALPITTTAGPFASLAAPLPRTWLLRYELGLHRTPDATH
jgi:hypothetical protein